MDTNKVEYDSNNSGGEWWLTDQNWLDLEAAGWEVKWNRNRPDGNERFLGALATSAVRYGLSMDDAIDEWGRVTGLDPYALGCPCCGDPHYFDV